MCILLMVAKGLLDTLGVDGSTVWGVHAYGCEVPCYAEQRQGRKRRACWEEEPHNCQGEPWALGKGGLEEVKEHA